MRFAIFSDIHANRQAWEAVLADAQRQRAGTLICLGDVVGYGPKPLEVLTSVREVTGNFVLGNHDAAACGRLDAGIFNPQAREVIEWTEARLDAESLEFLRQVPLQMDGPDLLFVHAEVVEPGEFGYIDGVGAAEPNLRAMQVPLAFIGHTHLPTAFMTARKGGPVTQKPPVDFKIERGKRYIVNVGSVGEPRTTDVRASYVIYDDATNTVAFRKVDFDVDGYVADLEETGLDIKPYFVRVVEAGKHSTPPPTAAPQLALTHLPKTSETVVGRHGSMVVGRPAGLGVPVGMPMPSVAGLAGVKQPKSAAKTLLIMGLLVAICAAGVVLYSMGGAGRKTAGKERAGDGNPVLRVVTKEAPGTPKTLVAAAPSPPKPKVQEPLEADPTGEAKRAVPIRLMTVKVFPERFDNLEGLQEAERNEQSAEKKNVTDGVVDLAVAGGRPDIGLIWEGRLVVPEAGDYTFTLDSDHGSALTVDGKEVVRISGTGEAGGPQSGAIQLAKGAATPFRLEYFQQGGQDALDLKWSGKGLPGEVSLVRAPASGELATSEATKASPAPEPKPAEPKPVDPKPAGKLSEGWRAYWSLDHRDDGPGRFEKHPEGLIERLVTGSGAKVKVLVPESKLPGDWKEIACDTGGWISGWNGVGYEDDAGPLSDYIQTEVGTQPDRHPYSVLVRIPFTVADPGVYTKLLLQTRCTGGYVAYINGQLVGGEHAPVESKLRWNSRALRARPAKSVTKWNPISANAILESGKLVKGQNILAIQALNFGGPPGSTNAGCPSPAFLLQAELLALRPDDESVPEVPARSSLDLAVADDALVGKVVRAEGKFGDCYRFVKGHIRTNDVERFPIGKEGMTASLWFARDPQSLDGSSRRLLAAGANANRQPGWGLYLSSGKNPGSLVFVLDDGKKTELIRGGRPKLADGNWHHVAVTADRAGNRVRMFIDGAQVANEPSKILEGGGVGPGEALSIGGPANDILRHRGRLDDIAIWKRALAPSEIQRIYKNGASLGILFSKEKQ